MRSRSHACWLASLAVLSAAAFAASPAGGPMSFFVTSVGSGKGADFGGLEGADKHCQTLAAAAGAGGKTWRAYLSTSAIGEKPAVHARERIGRGPWRNAKGVVIARDLDELHGANKLTKQTALSEKGAVINGRGDAPNEHDILTGSTPDGRAGDATCRNWTTSGEGSAIVGHSDRTGLDESAEAKSWNSSHPSRGCGQEALKATGGAGLLYCFASN
ncbi:hypothetical protein BURC_01028 [Burkholderiaceae bacterium]|nr:hypothetical protein BURC_01028 [Burkholderiaceae bacterium]